jgi:trimeric autotransporter adhesin
MKTFLLVLLHLFVIKTAIAQQQITDFPLTQREEGSNPSSYIEFNNIMFFEAFSGGFGTEIWTLAENQDHATLLKDIYPGSNSSVNYYFSNVSVILNNKLYFVANDGTSDGEIWCTDGTPEGTEKITHSVNYNITQLTLVGDQFYFVKHSGDSLQVWKSNGTESGTVLVKRGIRSTGNPFFQGKSNGLFFFCFIPQYATESALWRSDGTSAGTYVLLNNFDGDGAGIGGTDVSTQYIEFQNQLFFVIRCPEIFGWNQSVGIMKTDGTVANTVPVKAIHDGASRLISYDDVISINNKLYFSFFEVNYKRMFIWESDGTGAGTKIIYDESGSDYFATSNLYKDGDKLVFCGKNVSGATALIRMNLTDYSLEYIKEIRAVSAAPSFFLNDESTCKIRKMNNGMIYIAVPGDWAQSSGWVSGLTAASTINLPVLDNIIYPPISDVFSFKNTLYFSKSSTDQGSELWKSDGTADGTSLFDNINTFKEGIFYNNYWVLNNKLIFVVDDGIHGEELCINNMNSENTIVDIKAGSQSSYPGNFTKLNGWVYFTADDLVHGTELWKTDGTLQGTQMVKDGVAGAGSTHISESVVFNDTLFCVTYRDGKDYLCKLKGDSLIEIKGLVGVTDLIACGNQLFFILDFPYKSLWVSDGTSEGTIALKDFDICRNLTRMNGKLYFTASEVDQSDEELWSADGTPSGTSLVKDIGPGYSSEPQHLISFGNNLYFTAYTHDSGRELWKSDGSEANTHQVADIMPGMQSAMNDPNFCVWNTDIFFSANDGIHGFELWKTNGSESGTILLKDINPGSEGSFPSQMASNESGVYLQSYDPEHGSELWKTNGTTIGTELVTDVLPGMLSSSPTNIAAIADELFFFAETVNDGRQIWKITTLQSSVDGKQESLFVIYPNPSKNIIYIQTDEKIANLNIYNNLGQPVDFKIMENSSVDISELTHGIYMMEFTIDGQRVVRKFIKE